MKRYLGPRGGATRPTRTTGRRCAASSGTAPDPVVAILDSSARGRTYEGIPIVGDGRRRAGVRARRPPSSASRSPGARLPPVWRDILRDVIDAGLDVEAGMHEFLADDPELAAAGTRARRRAARSAQAAGRPERPDRREPPHGAAVVLTVGSDCAIGKKTVALELHLEARAARARARSSSRRARPGSRSPAGGSPSTRSSPTSSRARRSGSSSRAPRAATCSGSRARARSSTRSSPASRSVSTTASAPHALVLCHMAGRHPHRGRPGPPDPAALASSSSSTSASRCRSARRGSPPSRSTRGHARRRRGARARSPAAEEETGLPADDPVRFGATGSWTPCLSARSPSGIRSAMTDPRVERLAEPLRRATRCELGEGEVVADRRRSTSRRRSCSRCYRAALRAGALPVRERSASRGLAELLLEEGSDEQLTYVSPVQWHEIERLDALVTIWSETNTRSLSRVDPARHAALHRARSASSSNRRWERISHGEMRWCGTLYPDQRARPGRRDVARRVRGLRLRAPATSTRTTRPRTGARRRRARRAARDRARQRPRAPHRRAGHRPRRRRRRAHLARRRRALQHAGRRGLHEPGRDGDRGRDPLHVPGRSTTGARSRTSGCGSRADASSRRRPPRGDDYLQSLLDMDEGARVLGEVAFGLNYEIDRFTRNILFDEKIGGTMHLALGSGFPQAGGAEHVRPALGHDLRPPRGRRGLRGRRARLEGRQVPRRARSPSRSRRRAWLTRASSGWRTCSSTTRPRWAGRPRPHRGEPARRAARPRDLRAGAAPPGGHPHAADRRRRRCRGPARARARDDAARLGEPGRGWTRSSARDVRIASRPSWNTRGTHGRRPRAAGPVLSVRGEHLRSRYLERAAAASCAGS